METIRKQAAKLREKVARQQQALLKHLGHFTTETIIVDQAEFNCHKHLQSLHKSTRDAKHFQKQIVRAVEGYIAASTKQMDVARKLAEDSCKYADESKDTTFPLSNVALRLGNSNNLMEQERETLMTALTKEVTEPLCGLISGAALEDARHSTQRYDKVRQEIESQMSDILKRRAKTKESEITPESCTKLKGSETRLQELKSSLLALGKEAATSMSSVEDQQQQITFQRLSAMVDAERYYHRNVLAILDKLHFEINLEQQRHEASEEALFIEEIVKKTDGELRLEADNEIALSSEGENERKVDWVPSAHFDRIEGAPANKVVRSASSLL